MLFLSNVLILDSFYFLWVWEFFLRSRNAILKINLFLIKPICYMNIFVTEKENPDILLLLPAFTLHIYATDNNSTANTEREYI